MGDHPVYLTFDIDCLDPAFAPGTGTPVCGGLSSHQEMCIRDRSYYVYTGNRRYNAQYEEYGPTYSLGLTFTHF